MIAPLKWSEVREPCEACMYHHVTAETPIGRFLISWKGWKKYDSPTIDETPWSGGFAAGVDVDDAKRIAEAEWQRAIGACLLPAAAPSVPEGWKLVPIVMSDRMVEVVHRAKLDGWDLHGVWAELLAAAPEPPRG